MTIGNLYRRLRDWGLVPTFFQKIARRLRNIYLLIIRADNLTNEINDLQNTIGNFRDEVDALNALIVQVSSNGRLSKGDITTIHEWVYVIERTKNKL